MYYFINKVLSNEKKKNAWEYSGCVGNNRSLICVVEYQKRLGMDECVTVKVLKNQRQW